MKKNEVKRTIEEVVRVEYIAEDGTVFSSEEECKKYEASALFVVSKKVKKLSGKYSSVYSLLNDGSEENELEVFDVQTQEDLDNLKRYLYLTAIQNGATDKTISDAFKSESGRRKEYVFDSVTVGHEVLIFWSYDKEWFWVHRDGSLNAYLDWIRDNYNKIVNKENKED
jgi:hypothetical protein